MATTGSILGSSTSDALEQLIAQYRQTQNKPIETLQAKKKIIESRQATYNAIKTKLKALQDIAEDLASSDKTVSKFATQTASSSDSDILTASADGSAVNTSHSILVTQLAKSDSVLSSRLTKASTSVATATGEGTKKFSITLDGTTTEISVAVGATDTNESLLTKIANAVNDKNVGIAASVVADTSTTSKIVFTSKDTGSDHAITMTESGAGNTLLDAIGLSAAVLSGRTAVGTLTGGYMYSDRSLLDAKLKVDNIDIVSQSNSVEDVISGATITLKATQAETAAPVTLTFAADNKQIKADIKSFMDAYNDLMTYMNDRVKTSGTDRGELAGDTLITQLRTSMKTILVRGISSAYRTGYPTKLTDVGIEFDRYGIVSIKDSDKLDDALDDDTAKVSSLFNSSDGVATQMYNLLYQYTKFNGQLAVRNDNLDIQSRNVDASITRVQKQIDVRADAMRAQYTKMIALANNLQYQQSMMSRLYS